MNSNQENTLSLPLSTLSSSNNSLVYTSNISSLNKDILSTNTTHNLVSTKILPKVEVLSNRNSNKVIGRFFLAEQPYKSQRKSYKNENRYLLPHPLIIQAREESPEDRLHKIRDGKVCVSLLDTDGKKLPDLLMSPDGSLTQQLEVATLTAVFSLKVLDTSDATMFKLLFVVSYNIENGGQVEEKIISQPFEVLSNRKKNIKGKPSVIDMRPSDGLTTEETEVWIKGRGFSDIVVVLFGDKTAKVTETSDNLLTVFAPSRIDMVSNTSVPVTISNKGQQDLLQAEKQLSFTYFMG